jgi:uncharacterized protein
LSKILLVLALVAGVFWWLRSRARPVVRKAPPPAPAKPAAPQPMVACAHCGLNLPAADAAYDVGGRPYCGDAHRLAGPRA